MTQTTDSEDVPHNCACKFVNDECIDACCYHADLEGKNLILNEQIKECANNAARYWNELLELRKRTPSVAGSPKVEFDYASMCQIQVWLDAGEPNNAIPKGAIKLIWQQARVATRYDIKEK